MGRAASVWSKRKKSIRIAQVLYVCVSLQTLILNDPNVRQHKVAAELLMETQNSVFRKDWFRGPMFSVPGPQVSRALKSEETYLYESSDDKEDLMCLL